MPGLPETYTKRVEVVKKLIEQPPRNEVRQAVDEWYKRAEAKGTASFDEEDLKALHTLVREHGYITPTEYDGVARQIVGAEGIVDDATMLRHSIVMLSEVLQAVARKCSPAAKVDDVLANLAVLPPRPLASG